MSDEQLVEKAYEMLNYAYAPYSNFLVGAAIECSDGSIYTGCNVENGPYGASICAERVALVKAISEGHKDIIKIAIIANSNDYCWPCGICRQMLNEFNEGLIVIANKKHEFKKFKLKELLVNGFGGKTLIN